MLQSTKYKLHKGSLDAMIDLDQQRVGIKDKEEAPTKERS